jgi:hypothetical protein
MRSAIGIVFLLILSLAGCESRTLAPSFTALTSPVAPSPVVVASTTGADATERWNLTETYLGHTGPEECIAPFDGKPRTPVTGLLKIERLNDGIRFITEHNDYVGTVVANEFVVSDGEDTGSYWECGKSRIHFRTEGRVSGHFLQNGTGLVGEGMATFLLDSGETIIRRWSWSATRQ